MIGLAGILLAAVPVTVDVQNVTADVPKGAFAQAADNFLMPAKPGCVWSQRAFQVLKCGSAPVRTFSKNPCR